MDFSIARRNMVNCQIRTDRVTDPVILRAFLELPRERFVAEAWRDTAYVDCAVPVARGRHLVEPRAVARLLQALAIGGQDSVLVAGSGTGYEAALAARLASVVFALESDPALGERAREILPDVAAHNVILQEGPLAAGWPEQGPYNVILVNGGVPEVPQALFDQLDEEGRLGAFLLGRGRAATTAEAVVYTRKYGTISRRSLFETAVMPLPGFEKPSTFVF